MLSNPNNSKILNIKVVRISENPIFMADVRVAKMFLQKTQPDEIRKPLTQDRNVPENACKPGAEPTRPLRILADRREILEVVSGRDFGFCRPDGRSPNGVLFKGCFQRSFRRTRIRGMRQVNY